MTSAPIEYEDVKYVDLPQKGVMGRTIHTVRPAGEEAPLFVFPALAHSIAVQSRKQLLGYVAVAILTIGMTIGLITLLLQVPGLHYSVVNLLTIAFETVLPHGFAIAAAWIFGLGVVLLAGSFININTSQREFESLKVTKFPVYDVLLRFALWEEMAFRAGAEKWSWAGRIRMCIIFGLIHITNIWYSFAAGIALGATGFVFMAFYLWTYRKTQSQVHATASAGVLHGLYNTIAISGIALYSAISLVLHFIS